MVVDWQLKQAAPPTDALTALWYGVQAVLTRRPWLAAQPVSMHLCVLVSARGLS